MNKGRAVAFSFEEDVSRGPEKAEGETVTIENHPRTSLGHATLLLAVVFVFMLGAAESAMGSSRKSPGDPTALQNAGEGYAAKDEDAGDPRDVLREIRIPRGAAAFFDGIYARRQKEIEDLVNQNPEMIWPAIDLFLDALPALRAIPRNGGKLLVDGQVYEKANRLLAQCEKKASPEFGDDLKQVRGFIEKRSRHVEGNKIAIDLN